MDLWQQVLEVFRSVGEFVVTRPDNATEAAILWYIAVGTAVISLLGLAWKFLYANPKQRRDKQRRQDQRNRQDAQLNRIQARLEEIATPSGGTSPAQHQSLTATLNEVSDQAAAGDDRMAAALDLLGEGEVDEALALLIAEARAQETLQDAAAAKAAAAYRHAGAIAHIADHAKARWAYGKAIELDPMDTQSRLIYSELQVEAGNLDAAEAACREVQNLGNTGIDPSHTLWAHLGLGDLSAVRGSLAEAEAHFQAALAIAQPSPTPTPRTPDGSATSPSPTTGSATCAKMAAI